MSDEIKEMTISDEEAKHIMRRIIRVKSGVLIQYPFYGHLLLQLPVVFGKCDTACTNMRWIMFDPEFVSRISDDELKFVMLHEILHCVLEHCMRGVNKNSYIYNVAADIVVNSNIMASMGVTHFEVDGKSVMHSYNNKEGYNYGTEKLYQLISKKYADTLNDVEKTVAMLKKEYGIVVDEHSVWRSIPKDASLRDEWKVKIKKAAQNAKATSKVSLPKNIERYLEDMEYEAQINWREVLHDFLNLSLNDMDYSFIPSDRRFASNDFIMPSFTNSDREELNNVWFVIDTSPSVETTSVGAVLKEIQGAIEQYEQANIMFSFFGEDVTTPQIMETPEDIDNARVKWYGGTTFARIFEYMQETMLNKLPVAVIVLTDGKDKWPEEAASLEVPTLWVIVDNKDVDAPWGTTIHVRTDMEEFLNIPEEEII